jgi:hypothetical protein
MRNQNSATNPAGGDGEAFPDTEKKHSWKEKTGREKSVFIAGLLIFRQFQSIFSFPLDTEVNR